MTTDNVISFPTIDYWGGCPHCGRHDGYLNDGPEHWFVCHRHRVKWSVGSGLFSGWREETDAERFRQQEQLAGYREVAPLRSSPPIRRSDQSAEDLDDLPLVDALDL